MSSARKVYTSVTHPIRIDWLDPSVAGPVGLTFAPGKKRTSLSGIRWERDLDTDLTGLVAQGVGVLVCLLEDRDLAPNGISDLFVQAEQHGLEVLRLPIPDQGVPPTQGTWTAFSTPWTPASVPGPRSSSTASAGSGEPGSSAAAGSSDAASVPTTRWRC